MAEFHKIHSKIWTDSWFYDLNIYEQHLFIYLFSNSRATIAGIYELPMPVMAAEIKMTPEQIEAAFQTFEAAGKAYYDNGVVWVKNLRTYHETPSPQLQKGIQRELDNVKDCPLKRRYIAFYNEEEEPEEPGRTEPEPDNNTEIEQDNDTLQDTPSDYPKEGIDRVSIGYQYAPSLVLSSNKSKSTTRARGKNRGGVRAGPRNTPTPADMRVQAVLDVCGLDASVPTHVGQAEWAAAQLDNYTAEDIWDRFSKPQEGEQPAHWNWFVDDFRGRRGEMPTPKWVVENISKVVYRQGTQPGQQADLSQGEGAYSRLLIAMKSNDYRSLPADIKHVLRAMKKQTRDLQNIPERELAFFRRDFIEAYNAAN